MTRRSGMFLEQLLEHRSVQLTIGVLSCAAAGFLIGTGRTQTLTLAAIVVVGAAVLTRWPALTVLSLLIVCQELNPASDFGGASASGLLFLGHQLYFTNVGRVSLIVFAVVLAAASTAATTRPSHPQKAAIIVAVLLGAYCTAIVWAGGSALTSAINQDSLFAVLFAATFMVGLGAAQNRDWQRYVIPVLLCALSGMALVGMYLAATGQGAGGGGTSLIFYDSAMGAFAGAIVLAVISMPASQRDWRIWWLGGAALAIVVLSARRNVWAAMAVALLVGITFSRNRVRLVLRLLTVTALLGIALAILQPSVMNEIGHQLSAIWEATQGTAADTSTHGHLSDISIGWAAVKHSPITGVGPGGQIAGLVVQANGPLYIHNQVLESWLRFGLVGALLIVALQVVLVVQAVRVIRRPGIDFSTNWAAQFLLMAPVASLTAPFLTNTQRWPAILGLAAGLVAAVNRTRAPAATPASEATLAPVGA